MNRRIFLRTALVSSVLWPNLSTAFPIYRLLGSGRPEYLKEYFSRLYRWYCDQFFDFERHLSAPEKAFAKQWLMDLHHWGVPLNSTQMFEHFLFSHQILNGKINSSRLALGSQFWSPSLKQKLIDLKRHRGFQVKFEEHLFGIGWNFEADEFKFYYLFNKPEKVKDPDLRVFSLAHSDSNWLQQRICSHTYRAGKEITKKLIIPMKTLDWTKINISTFIDALSACKIISPSEERWFFRLRSIFFPLVNQSFYPIVSKHQSEFHQQADAVVYSKTDPKIFYYP